MAKQYISKNNDFYLQDYPLKLNLSLPSLVISGFNWFLKADNDTLFSEDEKSAAKKAASYLKNLLPLLVKNYSYLNYWRSEKLGHVIFKNKQTQNPLTMNEAQSLIEKLGRSNIAEGHQKITEIIVPKKHPSKYLKATEPGSKCRPDLVHQTKEQSKNVALLLAALEKCPTELKNVPEIGVNKSYYSVSLLMDYKNPIDTYIPKTTLMEALKEYQVLCETIDNALKPYAEDFTPYDFKLKYFEGRSFDSTDSLANQEAYYLFTEKEKGGFITLKRTRHQPPKYEWGVSPAIENAYLFQSPLEDYQKELQGYLYHPAQVFVDMKFKKIEAETVSHPKIQAIQAIIEKKNLSEDLEELLPSTPQEELTKTVVSKKHKI